MKSERLSAIEFLFDGQSYDPNMFFLIAGPCVVEDEPLLMTVAGEVSRICRELGIPYVFKSSYRKANRTRVDSFTGIGDEAALALLQKVKTRFHLPVLTDIHTPPEAAMAAAYVDVLQIPAFLCRQTELLQAAGATGKAVNIKKGQFVSGEAMRFAVDKVRQTGNERIMLTERGSMFGYGDLVVDFRNIPIMQASQVPVVVDCTHSLQQPNQASGVTGGRPQLIQTIARAAIAAGADGIFIETHPEPAKAKSDGANMLPLAAMEDLLKSLVRIREAILPG
ncbi:MAG: 3-deoxy-8-phosphooctulonate synthase [Thermoflavifilum sp.]|nr:3-deoxy-8-phosphooctulonate synthase [Thermoflavifilum sp.]